MPRGGDDLVVAGGAGAVGREVLPAGLAEHDRVRDRPTGGGAEPGAAAAAAAADTVGAGADEATAATNLAPRAWVAANAALCAAFSSASAVCLELSSEFIPASAAVCVCAAPAAVASLRCNVSSRRAASCARRRAARVEVMIDCSCRFASDMYCNESSSCWKPRASSNSETTDCCGCSYWLRSSAASAWRAMASIRRSCPRWRRSRATASLAAASSLS
jgi:hypothetical protein